jgi:hypothetical protein
MLLESTIFQLLRKWRVDLVRYGLRMTYDLVIPNPGASLASRHKELYDLGITISKVQDQIRDNSNFRYNGQDVTRGFVESTLSNPFYDYAALAAAFQTTLDPPPANIDLPMQGKPFKQTDNAGFDTFEFDVPEGYQLTAAKLHADLVHAKPETPYFGVPFSNQTFVSTQTKGGGNGAYFDDNTLDYFRQSTGHIIVYYEYGNVQAGQVMLSDDSNADTGKVERMGAESVDPAQNR